MLFKNNLIYHSFNEMLGFDFVLHFKQNQRTNEE